MAEIPEKFPLLISNGLIKYHLICELLNRNRSFETFRIYPEESRGKYLELTGNRPMLRAKGLRKKAIHWEVKGDVRNQYTVDKAIKLIEVVLEPSKLAISTLPINSQNGLTRSPNIRKQGPKHSTNLGDRSS